MVSNYVILSYMAKQFHPYYTSAMAPAIAGCVAIGTVLLWRHRSERIGTFGLSALTLSATVMAFVLLRRIPTWQPWLRWVLLIGGLVVAIALTLGVLERNSRLRYAIATLALAVSLGDRSRSPSPMSPRRSWAGCRHRVRRSPRTISSAVSHPSRSILRWPR